MPALIYPMIVGTPTLIGNAHSGMEDMRILVGNIHAGIVKKKRILLKETPTAEWRIGVFL